MDKIQQRKRIFLFPEYITKTDIDIVNNNIDENNPLHLFTYAIMLANYYEDTNNENFIKESLKYFLKAAELSSNTSIKRDIEFYLGVIYGNGIGVNQNRELALEYYKKSIDLGNERALEDFESNILPHLSEIEQQLFYDSRQPLSEESEIMEQHPKEITAKPVKKAIKRKPRAPKAVRMARFMAPKSTALSKILSTPYSASQQSHILDTDFKEKQRRIEQKRVELQRAKEERERIRIAKIEMEWAEIEQEVGAMAEANLQLRQERMEAQLEQQRLSNWGKKLPKSIDLLWKKYNDLESEYVNTESEDSLQKMLIVLNKIRRTHTSSEAILKMAYLYDNYTEDKELAMKYYKMAAGEYPSASLTVAHMYLFYDEIERDLSKALEYAEMSKRLDPDEGDTDRMLATIGYIIKN